MMTTTTTTMTMGKEWLKIDIFRSIGLLCERGALHYCHFLEVRSFRRYVIARAYLR